MHLICRVRATGKLIESQQSQGTIAPGTLMDNAVAAGFVAADVEVVEVTPAEWAAVKKEWLDDPAEAARLAQPNYDAELATAIRAVGTTAIIDPAARAAIEGLKSALLGGASIARAKGRSA